MISSEKYRVSIQITLADIFADFNDSRKEILIRRVKLALEDLEIRMRNEVESNNLANLQMLLKKQQALKKMEEKLEEATQELEEKRERDNYLSSKITEQQAELAKNADFIKSLQEKLRSLNESLNQRETQLLLKEETLGAMGKQLHDVRKQNQRLEMEREKLETTVKRLHQSVHHKTEEAELILKIKQKKLEESINQSINSLHIRQQRQKEKQEIENRLKSPKIEKRNQRIQVNIAPNPPPTSRHRDSQLSSRAPVKTTIDRESQTDPTQQKKIIEFIDNTPPTKQEKLEEIRLVYSATPKFLQPIEEQPIPRPPSEPKITKYIAPQVVEEQTQTDPVFFKPPTPVRFQQTCQVYVDEDSDFIETMHSQLEELKAKYAKMEQYHGQRQWELLKIYEERPSQAQDVKEIELLKLSLLETQLELEKKDKEIAQQRDLYSQVTHDLLQTQNSILLKKLNVKLGDNNIVKRPRFNQTCSFFNTRSPKRIQTQLSENNLCEIDDEEVLLNTKMNAPSTQQDIITITKSKHSIKYRRHSLKNASVGLDGFKDKSKVSRDYRKYSKLRIINPQ